jgi:hypothetical protein
MSPPEAKMIAAAATCFDSNRIEFYCGDINNALGRREVNCSWIANTSYKTSDTTVKGT